MTRKSFDVGDGTRDNGSALPVVDISVISFQDPSDLKANDDVKSVTFEEAVTQIGRINFKFAQKDPKCVPLSIQLALLIALS